MVHLVVPFSSVLIVADAQKAELERQSDDEASFSCPFPQICLTDYHVLYLYIYAYVGLYKELCLTCLWSWLRLFYLIEN